MFLISKIVGILINPILWVALLVIVAIVARKPKWKRFLLISATSLFMIFTNGWIPTKLTLAWQTPQVELRRGENYQAGILLGGYLGHDDNDGRNYFNAASDRFIETVRLYKNGNIGKIILSGSSGSIWKKPFIEAENARSVLREIGVPDQDIILEGRSRNTMENALYVKAILDSMQMEGPYLLITSALHMPRASLLFERSGLQIRPFPCAYMVTPQSAEFEPDLIIPSAQAIQLWTLLFREVIGYGVARWKK